MNFSTAKVIEKNGAITFFGFKKTIKMRWNGAIVCMFLKSLKKCVLDSHIWIGAIFIDFTAKSWCSRGYEDFFDEKASKHALLKSYKVVKNDAVKFSDVFQGTKIIGNGAKAFIVLMSARKIDLESEIWNDVIF